MRPDCMCSPVFLFAEKARREKLIFENGVNGIKEPVFQILICEKGLFLELQQKFQAVILKKQRFLILWWYNKSNS